MLQGANACTPAQAKGPWAKREVRPTAHASARIKQAGVGVGGGPRDPAPEYTPRRALVRIYSDAEKYVNGRGRRPNVQAAFSFLMETNVQCTTISKAHVFYYLPVAKRNAQAMKQKYGRWIAS